MRQIKIQQKISNRDSESINKFFTEVSQIEMITYEEEVILAERIQQGDDVARERLAKANLRFVISVAKQYQNGNTPLGDLINEGNMGLMQAVDRFDHTRGFKFISYAVWWIRQSIIAALERNGRMIRLPGNRSGMLHKINQFVDQKVKETGHIPSPDEICEAMDIEYDVYISILEASMPCASLDKPLLDGETSTLADIMESDIYGAPDEDLIETGMAQRIKAMLKQLPPREARVLTLSFGIDQAQPWTLEAIAEELDLTRERVRQIKEKALRRLRCTVNVRKNYAQYL